MNKVNPVRIADEELKKIINDNSIYKVIIDPDKKLIIEADQKTHELFNLEDKKLIGMTLQAFNKILSGFISSVPYVALKKSQGDVLVCQTFAEENQEAISISKSRYLYDEKPLEILEIEKKFVSKSSETILLNKMIFESDNGILIINSNDLMNGKIAYATPKASEILGYPLAELYSSSLSEHLNVEDSEAIQGNRIEQIETLEGKQVNVESLQLSFDKEWIQLVKISKTRYINTLDYETAEKGVSYLIEMNDEVPGYLIDVGLYFEKEKLKHASYILGTVRSIMISIFRSYGIQYKYVELDTDIFVFTTSPLDLVLKALSIIIDDILMRKNMRSGYSIRARFAILHFGFLKQVEVEELCRLRGEFGESEYNTVLLHPSLGTNSRYITLRQELKNALDGKSFELHAQSIVNLNTKCIEGYEIYLRWNHPKLGLITPEDFIGFAESNGWVRTIDTWVIKKTFQYLSETGLTDEFRFHINVSSMSFTSETFAETICNLASAYNIRRSMIVIEVAENNSYEAPVEDLVKLRNEGFLLAIDDFGKGYASFQRLRENRYDYIKIDGSFIQNIDKSIDAVMILNGIISLSNTLNINVIIEGVEKYEQMAFAKDKACYSVQGFLFDKPYNIENVPMNILSVQQKVQMYSQEKRYSQKRLKANNNGGHLNIQVLDENFNFVIMSDLLSSYLHYDLNEIERINFMEVVEPSHQDMTKQLFHNAKTGDPTPAIFIMLLGAGGVHVGCIVIAEYDNFENQFKVFIELAESLEESEKKLLGLSSNYLEAFNEAPVGIILLSDDFRILKWNRQSSEIFGYMPYEVEKKNLIKLVSIDKDLMKMNRVLGDVQENASKDLILKNVTKSNRTIFCRWMIKHIHDSYESRHFYVCMVSDITEDLNKSKKLRKLNTALDQSESMIIITNVEGIVEYVNDRYQELTGIKKEDILHQHWMTIISGEQPHDFGKSIYDCVSNGLVWQGEVHLRKRSNEYFWTSGSVFPVIEEGQNAGYVCLLKDVTEEKELMEVNKHYREKVADQEKVATLGYLTSGIMHEINSPLSYVRTNVEYLETVLSELKGDSIDVDDFKETIADCLVGLKQISEITSSMKKHLYKREENEKASVDIIEELRTVLLLTKNEYKYNANIQLQYNEDEKVYIVGNASKLRQVFMNLIINASHAIADKHISRLGKLKIGIEEKEDHVLITFADNGKGIKPQNIESIFEPFFTTKSEGVGTGLGLSISKSIIEEEHSGLLKCSSVEGEGTTFTIELPKEDINK